jgi:hypothetical protein
MNENDSFELMENAMNHFSDSLRGLVYDEAGYPHFVDIRALGIIVPAVVLATRSWIAGSVETTAAWALVGALGFLWIRSRVYSQFFGRSVSRSSNQNAEAEFGFSALSSRDSFN